MNKNNLIFESETIVHKESQNREFIDLKKREVVVFDAFIEPEGKRESRENNFIHEMGETPKEIMVTLKEELALMHKRLNDLQMIVKQKDKKVEALTEQIIDFSLQLAEKEMVLSKKVDYLSSLSYEYDDLYARFELGQKIIQEKNLKIQAMEDSRMRLESDAFARTEELKNILSSKDEKLFELSGILGIYKGMLKDSSQEIKLSSRNILAMQEQLMSVRAKLFEKDTALSKTKQKLVLLENRLMNAHEKIKEFRDRQLLKHDATGHRLRKEILNLQSAIININEYRQVLIVFLRLIRHL